MKAVSPTTAIALAVSIVVSIAAATAIVASRPADAAEDDQYELWWVETTKGSNYTTGETIDPQEVSKNQVQSIVLTADRPGYTLNARLNVRFPQTLGVLEDFKVNLRSVATFNLKKEAIVVSASVIAPGGPRKDRSDKDHLTAGSTHQVSIDLPKDYSPDEQGYVTIKLAPFGPPAKKTISTADGERSADCIRLELKYFANVEQPGLVEVTGGTLIVYYAKQ
jgi:FlaG/FlaF family flagellin (archaellin)